MTQQDRLKEAPGKDTIGKLAHKLNDPFWGISLAIFVFLLAGFMGAVSCFGTKPSSAPTAKTPGMGPWRVDPHRSLMDIDKPEVLIGFKSTDKVYLDISAFCEQAGFRSRAGVDRQIAPPGEGPGKLLVETPDIVLPESLDRRIFSVVSADMAPEVRVFDSPYQWLGDAHGPLHGACLLLGKKTVQGAPKKLDAFTAAPVIALASTDMPAELRLNAQAKAVRVTSANREGMVRKYPWLLQWLNEFSSNAAKQCGPDEFRPLTTLMPVHARLSPDARQTRHWVAASGCGGQNDWSLVITNEDETISFVRLSRRPIPDDYRPSQVWTSDTDADGTPEFLVRAQYADGWRYVLLRLNTDEKAGYNLVEVTKTAFHGD